MHSKPLESGIQSAIEQVNQQDSTIIPATENKRGYSLNNVCDLQITPYNLVSESPVVQLVESGSDANKVFIPVIEYGSMVSKNLELRPSPLNLEGLGNFANQNVKIEVAVPKSRNAATSKAATMIKMND